MWSEMLIRDSSEGRSDPPETAMVPRHHPVGVGAAVDVRPSMVRSAEPVGDQHGNAVAVVVPSPQTRPITGCDRSVPQRPPCLMVPTCLIDRRWREMAAMLDLAIPLVGNSDRCGRPRRFGSRRTRSLRRPAMNAPPSPHDRHHVPRTPQAHAIRHDERCGRVHPRGRNPALRGAAARRDPAADAEIAM